ncbi:MAG: hypothetical protein WAW06_06305 [bacterium]
MSKSMLKMLSHLCLILGLMSIGGSILMWAVIRGDGTPEALAHAERWGLFIGLWVPSFFALSIRLDRYADSAD